MVPQDLEGRGGLLGGASPGGGAFGGSGGGESHSSIARTDGGVCTSSISASTPGGGGEYGSVGGGCMSRILLGLFAAMVEEETLNIS